MFLETRLIAVAAQACAFGTDCTLRCRFRVARQPWTPARRDARGRRHANCADGRRRQPFGFRNYDNVPRIARDATRRVDLRQVD
jgi:hypothetical protein